MSIPGCFLALLAISCAANVARPGNVEGVTSLQAENDGRALHEISTVRSPVLDPRSTDAVEALCEHDYAGVIASTEAPANGPAAGWLDYDRAAAFAGLARTDEAVETFKRAELRFAAGNDLFGRSVAIWGRARALAEAGRCTEAQSAYEDYESFVRLRDPRAAEMAAAYSGACRPRVVMR